MKRLAAKGDGGFRVLLVVMALLAVVLGVWGLIWAGALHAAFGFEVAETSPGFVGIARLYGAVMIAVGVAAALAAVDPMRNRALLVVLFVAFAASGVASVVSAARGELAGFRGAVFAIIDAAICLLFFRLYPRPRAPEEPAPKT